MHSNTSMTFMVSALKQLYADSAVGYVEYIREQLAAYMIYTGAADSTVIKIGDQVMELPRYALCCKKTGRVVRQVGVQEVQLYLVKQRLGALPAAPKGMLVLDGEDVIVVSKQAED